jgi:thiamine biosynthesis lipoprotein
MRQITFRAMGCQILAVIDTNDARADAWLAQVPAWFATWEQHLSRFRTESELARVNAGAGRPVQVSPVFWAVLQAALWAARQSRGLVTPVVLDALEAAGYDRTFDALGLMGDGNVAAGTAHQGSPVVARPSSAQDWRAIRLSPRDRTITLPAGMRLDLGGIAKGWAATRAVERLRQLGPTLVDAGGDIAVSGPRADGSPWPIGVANPFAPEEILELLLVARGGVATSGRDYRRWRQGAVWRHHIIDPRSGQPAATDVLSATVIAPQLCAAEVGAKVALILGSEEGLAWIEARPHLAGLLVRGDGTVIRSARLARFIGSTNTVSGGQG